MSGVAKFQNRVFSLTNLNYRTFNEALVQMENNTIFNFQLKYVFFVYFLKPNFLSVTKMLLGILGKLFSLFLIFN